MESRWIRKRRKKGKKKDRRDIYVSLAWIALGSAARGPSGSYLP
jgi:hypothetical protein